MSQVEPLSLKLLRESQSGFANMANMAYKELRSKNPEVHRHARTPNIRLASNKGLDAVARKIWSTRAEIALVDQLLKKDPNLAPALTKHHRRMRQVASEIMLQLRAYDWAHPEDDLDMRALTQGWLTFRGTTADIHFPIPPVLDRVALHPTEHLLKLIKWRPR